MVTNETLYHKNPKTGEPQVIGLGWLDDSMRKNGPTEEDRNYIADTGASDEDMKEQVAAYEASMLALKKKVVPMGGYWWQLMDTGNTKLAGDPHGRGPHTPITPAQCKSTLRGFCQKDPPSWNKLTLNNIPGGGKNLQEAELTQYTAEFMLTRGTALPHQGFPQTRGPPCAGVRRSSLNGGSAYSPSVSPLSGVGSNRTSFMHADNLA